MDIVELLRRCQGAMCQTDFADHLGISRSLLSMVYSGQRKPGRAVVAALVRRFPETREMVVDMYLDVDDAAEDAGNGNGNNHHPAPCSQPAQ